MDEQNNTIPDVNPDAAYEQPNMPYNGQPDAAYYEQQNAQYNGQPNVPYGQPGATYYEQQNTPYNGQPNVPYGQPNVPYNPQPVTPYGVAPGYQPYGAPVAQRKTNKGLAKFIFLSLITFGIYGIVVMSTVSEDINIIASRYDGKKTMHYCLLLFLIGPITFGIAYLVWFNNISSRIGNELRRRMIPYSFGASDFWLWNILGSIIIVGPFIYYYKLFKATNLMCENYNLNG